MTQTPTRGERNANPGNIDRNATRWLGMAIDQHDSRFVVFAAPEYGIRALAKVLLSYYAQHGLHTVQQIIDRWAPPGENDTAAYVRHVAGLLDVPADDAIEVSDPSILETLVRAIIEHENGRCIYDQSVIDKGVGMALGRV